MILTYVYIGRYILKTIKLLASAPAALYLYIIFRVGMNELSNLREAIQC